VCNNLVLGVSMAAVAEGLALGTKLGLDPKLLSDIFNSSSARCWSSDSYNPCPVQLLCSAIVMSAYTKDHADIRIYDGKKHDYCCAKLGCFVRNPSRLAWNTCCECFTSFM